MPIKYALFENNITADRVRMGSGTSARELRIGRSATAIGNLGKL